jgi:hypothetical protein
MRSEMPDVALTLPTQAGSVPLDRLATCVQRLDPATRALLDLSVRRGVRDDLMAPILRTDAFHLAWRRARALEHVASEVGGAPLGEVRMALEALPREAWGLPGVGPPALPPGPSSSASPKRFAREASPAPPPAAAGTALVPAAAAELDVPVPAGRIARLDAFASESPPLRLAVRQLGRALAAKAVRLVVWRRAR